MDKHSLHKKRLSKDNGQKQHLTGIFSLGFFKINLRFRVFKKREILGTPRVALLQCKQDLICVKGNVGQTNWPSYFDEGVRYPTTQIYRSTLQPKKQYKLSYSTCGRVIAMIVKQAKKDNDDPDSVRSLQRGKDERRIGQKK